MIVYLSNGLEKDESLVAAGRTLEKFVPRPTKETKPQTTSYSWVSQSTHTCRNLYHDPHEKKRRVFMFELQIILGCDDM